MNLKNWLSAQNFIIWLNALKESMELTHRNALTDLFPLGKAKHCGNKRANKVILKNGVTNFYSLKVTVGRAL